MKKFLTVLCTVAMVAALATSAFAAGSRHDDPFTPSEREQIEADGNEHEPFRTDESTSSGGGAGTGTAAQTGGGAAVAPAAPAASAPAASAPAASASSASSGSAAATTPAKTDAAAEGGAAEADPAEYAADPELANSGAKALVDMLNAPAGADAPVYTTADVVAALGIEAKTVGGRVIDLSKLTIISKALDRKSKGVKFDDKEDGSIEATVNGNELTKGREKEQLVIIAAPKKAVDGQPKAFLVDLDKFEDNILNFKLSVDCAFCIALYNE